MIFIDQDSRFTWFFPLVRKSDVHLAFKSFKPIIENLLSCKIKTLRMDGVGEFINTNLQSFLSSSSITHQISCPYMPQQNGVVERKHRHIIETTISLLQTASMPQSF